MSTRTPHLTLALSLAATMLSACSGTPEKGSLAEAQWLKEKAIEGKTKQMAEVIDSAPEWYAQPKCDAQSLCAVASATSSDMQLSIDKAVMDAKFIVADKLKGTITANMKVYVEESGAGDDPMLNQEVSKVISNAMSAVSLAGYEVAHSKTLPERGKFRTFVALKYPLGEGNQIVLAETHKNRLVESKLRASKAFAELEKQVSPKAAP